MSVATAPSIVIKVPVHAGKPRAAPAVAARLQARSFPARHGASPEAVARKELIVAARKARVSANAAAHNARVSDVHDVTALVESQVKQYRRSSIDRRLESASALRARHLLERAAKASASSARAAAAESRVHARAASVAAKQERKLESASEARRRRLDAVAFRAADAAARVKSAARERRVSSSERAAELDVRLRRASRRRDAITNRVALKASFFSLRAARAAMRAEAKAKARSQETASRLARRVADAEILRQLDVRLRQCKAALVVERASHVVERRRLSDSVAPMLGAARLDAQLARAAARREGVVAAVARKARAFVRRAVVTCATHEVNAERSSAQKRASLEARVDAAARRKARFLERGARGRDVFRGDLNDTTRDSFARRRRRERFSAPGSVGGATDELARRFAENAAKADVLSTHVSSPPPRPTTSRGVQTDVPQTARVSA